MNDEPGIFPKEFSMARVASLLVLLAIISVLGFVFVRVMASFWLPLFLAALLVVIFRPLHQWILDACEGKQKRSAILTTLAILLAVLGPLVWVGFVAFDEARGLLARDWSEVLSSQNSQANSNVDTPIDRIRAKLKLDMPYSEPLRDLEVQFKALEEMHPPLGDEAVAVDPAECEQRVRRFHLALDTLRQRVMDKLIETLKSMDANDEEFVALTYRQLLGADASSKEIADFVSDPTGDKHTRLVHRLSGKTAAKLLADLEKPGAMPVDDNEFVDFVFRELLGTSVDETQAQQYVSDSPNWRRALIARVNPSQFDEVKSHVDASHAPIFAELNRRKENRIADSEEKFLLSSSDQRECRLNLDKASLQLRNLKRGWLGGPIYSWVRGIANPTTEQLQEWQSKALIYFQQNVVSLTGQTTAIVGSFAFGLFVLTISLYYFLIDGPKLIRAAMRLSPLDNKYEQELFAEFGNVSRAVVLATLLSAMVQGLLAGLGYWAVGAKPLFLLTLLTGLLAMVPFVGAAAVWVPVSLWVMFAQPTELAEEAGRLIPGIGLAVYGAVIVSMADNLIKPWVLAGQSNLHPLLGLLSVLGGVKTLGPIGLLVGPMVVSFLQALLNMLNAELGEKKKIVHDDKAAADDVASVVVRRKIAPSGS